MRIQFLLNGETVDVQDERPTRTVLEWIRESKELSGTKEGCNEGDCGACTVMVSDENGSRAVNSCILLLPQIHGKAVRTVEGISGPAGALHPVQKEMIEHHGSQCGFCTPGFIVSMATAHKNDRRDFDDQIAGNLCRCTGYAPIIRAASAAADTPVPDWMTEDLKPLKDLEFQAKEVVRPKSTDELAHWFEVNPDATLIAGATDVGLWLTKRLMELDKIAFLSDIKDLQGVKADADWIRVGAGTTITDLAAAISDIHPDFAEMLRRYGSVQVRNSATIGGNIANGSPIGDGPPALIALGAVLHLRKGTSKRELLLQDFFLDYGKQDMLAGEFVEAIGIPRQPDRLKCYKISKRFDQDISAVCGCFSITVKAGMVTAAKIAFGGMAGIPKRANSVEGTLVGQKWNRETIDGALAAFADDFTPLTDMRASADYRLRTAQNMLVRYFLEDQGVATRVLEVSA